MCVIARAWISIRQINKKKQKDKQTPTAKQKLKSHGFSSYFPFYSEHNAKQVYKFKIKINGVWDVTPCARKEIIDFNGETQTINIHLAFYSLDWIAEEYVGFEFI